MIIMLGEFNAKLWREVIFKPTVGNERIHQDDDDDDDDDDDNDDNNNNNNNTNNGVRVVNFVTLKI